MHAEESNDRSGRSCGTCVCFTCYIELDSSLHFPASGKGQQRLHFGVDRNVSASSNSSAVQSRRRVRKVERRREPESLDHCVAKRSVKGITSACRISASD